MNFLGSGYPLIFNYYLYCAIILTIFFLSFGVYAIYSNTQGGFCHSSGTNTHNITESNTTTTNVHRLLKNGRILSGSTHECSFDWVNYLSLANKLDLEEAHDVQCYFSIVTEFILIIILMMFRKHQRKIDAVVDEQTNTPSDYSIMVTGIPIGLKCDYAKELKNLFDVEDKNNKSYKVEKVNLVFDTQKLEEMEHRLKKIVDKKKKLLTDNEFDMERKEILELESEFHEIEEKIEGLKEHFIKTNENFAGVAFISFSTEDGVLFLIIFSDFNKNKFL